MSDAHKKRAIQAAKHLLMLWLLFLLQIMVFPRLRIVGIAPLLLPVAVVSIALFWGQNWGAMMGLFAGVISDAAFSGHTILFTVLLTACGFGIGYLSQRILSRGFPSHTLCSLLALILIAFCQMFPLLVFHRQPPLSLLAVGILQTAYSMLFVLPLYYVGRGRKRRL